MADGTTNDGDRAVSASNTSGEAEPAAGDAQAGQEQQPQQRQSGWQIIKTLAFRMFIMYMISSFFRRGSTPPANQQGGAANPMVPATNLFLKDDYLDLYVYISENEEFTDFDNTNALFWMEEELVYGDWASGVNNDGSYFKEGQVPISKAVQNNGSLYMHVYMVKAGSSPNPKDKTYNKRFTVTRTKKLNKLKKRRFHTTVNLLTGKTDAHPDLLRDSNETKVEILSHWHPNLTINLIDDHTTWFRGQVPAPLDEYIEFVPDGSNYYPIVFFNDYWNMQSDYMPINDTTPVLNLTLTYSPMSLFKWQMYAAQSMRSKWYSFMGEDFATESDEEQDTLKQTLTETNPYLLGLTVVVSLVHSVFEFLAFKNDIQFWRSRKSLEGLSVRSVFYNVFQSLVVVLYVMDNETNFVVRISVVIGLFIELWKINKVVDFKLNRENKILGIFPRLTFTDKSTYTESSTKQYDMLAFKYLSWLLFPLLGAYMVYSLMYQEHKSWYSWVLSMLYGFLLTFGFIMMTPQLFINYKLKSVAHLPWRMLTYKALNTFIDDIFAFVIKMPTLYRLGCFRDDIVFFIYLYQRYIYRVDPKRVNEFGTSAEMMDQNGEIVAPPADGAITEGESTEPKSTEEKKND